MYTIEGLKRAARSLFGYKTGGQVPPLPEGEDVVVTSELEKAKAVTEEDIEKLKSFCPIGGKFNYLGVTFVVLDHAIRKTMVNRSGDRRPVTVSAALITHYFNEISGEVDQHVFTKFEAEAIVAACEDHPDDPVVPQPNSGL